jgi:predicted Zn-dependent protease
MHCIAGRTHLRLREGPIAKANSAADGYGVSLMAKAGSDPRALAVILDRIAGAIEPPSVCE